MRGWLHESNLVFHPFHRFPLDETAYLHPITKPPRRWPQMADRGQPARIWWLRLLGYVSLARLHIILMYPPIGLSVKSHLPLVCTLSEVRNDFRSKCTRRGRIVQGPGRIGDRSSGSGSVKWFVADSSESRRLMWPYETVAFDRNIVLWSY